MTTTSTRAALSDLLPTIATRAAEIEAARRVPRDLLDDLLAAGCFRLLVPPSHGGTGADLLSALRVHEDLAAADASVAWIVMIGGGAWFDLVGLPRASFDAVFAAGPDTIVAGAFNPSGSVTPTEHGYRVEGRWGFASGCQHADWVYGNGIEGFADGHPMLRATLFEPSEVVIEDTWTATGLCATASHHFRVDGREVPAERTFVPLAGEPCIDAPIVRVPTPAFFALLIAGVALGIARGALADIVDLAGGKVPLLAPAPLATNPLFQHELAVADTEVAAARALLHEIAESTWDTAVEGDPFSLEARARTRAAAVWVTERATHVVDTAHRLGGGTAVYAESALQRRLRDVHALTQHFLVRPDTLTTAGALLAGQPLEVPVF
jgi:alkylation response protein AidB-like acyl-CoA dehydrogenase